MLLGCCCCTITVNGSVRNCIILDRYMGIHFQTYVGATVVIKDHTTGVTYFTGTTDSTGAFSGTLTGVSAAVFVDITATGTNGDTVTIHNLHLLCGNNTLTIVIPKQRVVFLPQWCFLANVGNCTITVSGGPTAGTCTTHDYCDPGDYTCTLDLMAGSYTYTASATRFATFTGTFTINANTCAVTNANPVVGVPTAASPEVQFEMSAASGYQCCPGIAYPIPTTLHASFIDSGDVVLTWNGTTWASVNDGTPQFELTFTSGDGSYPDCCPLPQVTDGFGMTFCPASVTYEGAGDRGFGCPLDPATNSYSPYTLGESIASTIAVSCGFPLSATYTLFSVVGSFPTQCQFGPYVLTVTE